MLVRIMKVTARDGLDNDLQKQLKEVSAGVFEQQSSLLQYVIGRTKNDDGIAEYVLMSLWPDADALAEMAGSDWKKPYIPATIRDLLQEVSIEHYEAFSYGPGKRLDWLDFPALQGQMVKR